MKRVILHCVPPFAVEYPSPALSVLQMWLTKHGIETSILYWNLLLLRLQRLFMEQSDDTKPLEQFATLCQLHCI